MKTKTAELTKKMVESALMIAFATVLSVVKLVDMPYGGSVTLASMLPVAIIAYRHGLSWGLASGGVYAVVQQLLGLENFSYLPVPTWQAMVALCVLDYLLAFVVIGLAGIFRGRMKREGLPFAHTQARELALGIALASVLRYILHTVAGFTVWAGLAIPSWSAFVYSVGYNATYMIPETIVNVTVALYLGSVVDLTRSLPMPFAAHQRGVKSDAPLAVRISLPAAALLIAGAVITDACLIFKHLQDAESGEFTFAYLGEVNWLAVGIVTAVCGVLAAALMLYAKNTKEVKTQGD